MTDISFALQTEHRIKKGVTSQLIEKGNIEGIDAVSVAPVLQAILNACETLTSVKRQ